MDGSDYTRIDYASLHGGTGWFNGDFNYDGTVNGSDYTLIDNAFNSQAASLAAELAEPAAVDSFQVSNVAGVPEPATLGIASVACLALLGRRLPRRQAK